MVAFLHRVMPRALSLVITEDKEILKRHSGELMGRSVKSVLNVLSAQRSKTIMIVSEGLTELRHLQTEIIWRPAKLAISVFSFRDVLSRAGQLFFHGKLIHLENPPILMTVQTMYLIGFYNIRMELNLQTE